MSHRFHFITEETAMPEAVIRTEEFLEGSHLTAQPALITVPMGFLGTAKK